MHQQGGGGGGGGGLSAWQNDKAKPGYVPGHFGVTLHSVHGRAGMGGEDYVPHSSLQM
jgi:hypothetical protein